MGESMVQRADLVAALSGSDPADRACRTALEQGSAFRVWPHPTSRWELVTIYRRRVLHLGERGIGTIGADTVVARLESATCPTVRLGRVEADGLDFVLFLDADVLVVVACLGTFAAVPG